MKNVTSFEEACTLREVDPSLLPNVEKLPARFQDAILAHYRLMVITEAVNEGKEPDWDNEDEYKYFPVFDVEKNEEKPSGFGLAYGDYVNVFSFTIVGSRLSSVESEAARFIGKNFIEDYEKLFLKPKS